MGVTLTPSSKLRVVQRGHQTFITAVLDSLLHRAVTEWCVWGVRQARQLKVYWGRVAGLLPPRPLRGVPARATESVNCRPAVILVYSHHPQPPTDNIINKADDIAEDNLSCCHLLRIDGTIFWL